MKWLLVALSLWCSAAFGQSIPFPGPGTAQAGGAPAFALTFGQLGTSTGVSTSNSFGTLSYASGNTRVILGIAVLAGSGTTSITGVTIGGTALSHVSGSLATQASIGGIITDIWESTGSLSGSSGAVVVTVSDSINPFSSTGYAATYSLTTTAPSASSANSATAGFGTTVAAAYTVPSGGGGLVVTGGNNGTAITSLSSSTIDSSTGARYFAHSTATGSLTPSALYSGGDLLAMSAAAWGP